jgi:hypothetical protein
VGEASLEEASIVTRSADRNMVANLDSESDNRNSFSDPGEAAPPPWRSR